MKQIMYSRVLTGTAAAFLVSLFSILAGCSSDSTGPNANNGNPPGSDATVSISDPVTAEEASSVRSNVSRNSQDTILLNVDSVVAIALAEYPNCEFLGVKLDYDRDELNYECVVRSGGKTYVVVVDPKTGKVKKKEEVDNAYYTTVIIIRTVVVKVKEAKAKAKQIVKEGEVIECNLEQVDERPTYIIIILDRQNRYITLYIDAETGKERKVKDDGKCQKGDSKDDDDDDDDDGGKDKKKKGRGHYRHGKGHGYGHRWHCHCECEEKTGDTTATPANVISVDSARGIATRMIDSSRVTEIKIDTQNDSTAFYNIKLERDSNRYEISIDAFDGSLVEIKQTAGNFSSSEYRPNIKGDTLVALSVARTAALAQLTGTIKEWKLEHDASEAKWIYTFTIDAGGSVGTKKVLVDAKTGLYLKTV